MPDYSTLSTQATSWPDFIPTIVIHDGETLEDIDVSSLSWGATRSRGQQSKHGRKYAVTRGSTAYSGSMSLYDTGWRALRPALLAVAASKNITLQDVRFDIIGKRKPVDSNVVETVKLENCLIDEVSADYSEGDDPDQVSLTLNVGNIVQIEDGTEVNLG